MKIINAKNPKWHNEEHTLINLLVDFEEFEGEPCKQVEVCGVCPVREVLDRLEAGLGDELLQHLAAE